MVENRPFLNVISHIILIFGIVIVALPIWITFVASTHDAVRMTQAPIPMLPGGFFWELRGLRPWKPLAGRRW